MTGKFPQRITALVTLDVFAEGLDWAAATARVSEALNGGAGGHDVALKKVTAIESIDEEYRS